MVVLITSVGTATAVNLIKYLKGRKDIKIIGTDINEMGYTAGSILADQFYQVPYANAEGYVNAVLDIIRKENVTYMIPVSDMEIEKWSAVDIWKGWCNSIMPSHDIVVLTRNKKRCNDLVQSLGIDVPPQIGRNAAKKRICRDITGVGSKGIAIYGENEQIEKFDPDSQIIQAFIEGEEYTVDILCDWDGNPLYIIPRKRLEIKSGVATKVAVVKNDALIAASQKILKHIKLPGLSNIQFIEDAEGKPWFVEINCRFSGCGAGTALACEYYLPSFFSILEGRKPGLGFNEGVKWDAVITRYYQEILFEKEKSIQCNGEDK